MPTIDEIRAAIREGTWPRIGLAADVQRLLDELDAATAKLERVEHLRDYLRDSANNDARLTADYIEAALDGPGTCEQCGGSLALATGVCTECGHDQLGYYDDDFDDFELGGADS